MPSQVVKLSTSTPISGMTPNAMNISSAGSAIQVTEPLRPPLEAGRLRHAGRRAERASVICR